jgi:hypothetical protein
VRPPIACLPHFYEKILIKKEIAKLFDESCGKNIFPFW